MTALLSIGDFARATHLSVKALRHYDDVGLLAPAEIDPSSGYRRYRAAQVPAAHLSLVAVAAASGALAAMRRRSRGCGWGTGSSSGAPWVS